MLNGNVVSISLGDVEAGGGGGGGGHDSSTLSARAASTVGVICGVTVSINWFIMVR